MYYTLSEEEYTDLARTSHQFEELELALAKQTEKSEFLQKEYSLLRDKYNRLLVFGVIASNERLKTTYDSRLN